MVRRGTLLRPIPDINGWRARSGGCMEHCDDGRDGPVAAAGTAGQSKTAASTNRCGNAIEDAGCVSQQTRSRVVETHAMSLIREKITFSLKRPDNVPTAAADHPV